MVFFLVLLALLPSTVGTDWYVAPSGTPSAAGTLISPWDLATALAQPASVRPGDTIWMEGGTYEGAPFVSSLVGAPGQWVTLRAMAGQRAVLVDHRNFASGATLQVNGNWSAFWGFEVMNDNTDRSAPSTVVFRPMGLQVQAPNTRFINLVVHDTGHGFGFWVESTDSEIYGTLVYNTGNVNGAGVYEYGHGIYTNNNPGSGTKRIYDCIVVNAFGLGLQGWPTSTAHVAGYDVVGSVFANSGVWSGNRFNNILFGVAGYGLFPVQDIRIDSTAAIHTTVATPSANATQLNANVFLGQTFSSTIEDVNLTATNNVIAGGVVALGVACWQNVTVTGNTVGGPLVAVSWSNRIPTSGVTWDSNTYYAPNSSLAFSDGVSTGNFSNWKLYLGGDSSSAFSNLPPRGQVVSVRPNQYEAGRAHVIVYNWPSLATAASVDPSGVLSIGDPFELRNSEDFFGTPVLSGTYTGGSLSVPMTGLNTVLPIGTGYSATPPPSVQFHAFILLRTNGTTATTSPPASGMH